VVWDHEVAGSNPVTPIFQFADWESVMSAQQTNELPDFHRFLTEKLSNGGATLTPEEVLDEWRESHPEPEQIDEDEFAAIQEALDDMKNGDHGRPFDEVMAELRAKYNLSSK
jgi:hypothetical protein